MLALFKVKFAFTFKIAAGPIRLISSLKSVIFKHGMLVGDGEQLLHHVGGV